jgi:glycosyltransferase involved in cell wall biosynthesis
VLVVDDGSSEEVRETLGGLGDSRVRVIRHEQRQGVARARNTGIFASTADWVAFLDDDDVWSPRKLRVQLDAVRASDAAFVYGIAALLDDDDEVVGLDPAPDPDGLLAKLLASNAIPAGASNVLARRDAVVDLGGFDERFSHFADWDLWIRLAANYRGVRIDEIVVAYRQHAGSMGITDAGAVSDEVKLLAETHAGLAAEASAPVDSAAIASWLGSLHRRGGRRIPAAKAFLRAAVGNVRHGKWGAARRSIRHSIGALSPGLRAAVGSRRRRRAAIHLGWLDRYR